MRYAAFLRAINVGTHNRIKMVDLRQLCESAGLRDVTTYLQTGNVLFDFDGDEPAAVAEIDAALAGHGLRNAAASVRSARELAELVAVNPFPPESEPKNRFVTLYQSRLPGDIADKAGKFANVVAVRPREIFAERTPDGGPGDITANLGKLVPLQGTTRYWHVVEEVARMLVPA
jgi:uncharacterized protein (DUF1697 family)